MKRLLIILALCAPAQAAISYVSSASAQASSVSFTTPTKGDIIVVCAHRDGSNTAPSQIGGYQAHANSSGSTNTNSMRIMWKLSDGTETSTGTSTNASSIAVAVYRGVNPTIALGASLKTNGTGTTLTYGSGNMTPQVTRDTSSWVIGCGAGNSITAGMDAPSGMTQRTVTTDISLSDTAAGTASWTAATDTVTGSSGWMTYTVELRAAQDTAPSPDPLIQWKSDASTEEAGNTFIIRFPHTSLSGNLLVLAFRHTTGRTITSVTDSNSTAWTAGPYVTNGGGYNDTRLYYLCGAPATSSVTIVFSGTVAQYLGSFYEFKGPPASSCVDGTPTGTADVTTLPIQSGSITTTQNGDLIFQYIADTQQSSPTLSSEVRGFASDGGFVLGHADIRLATASQYGIQASSGAINPGLMVRQPSNPDYYNALSIAFKMDGSGTSRPSGIRIIGMHTYSPFVTPTYTGTTATGENILMPTRGNLMIALSSNSSLQINYSAQSDYKGNVYTEVQPNTSTPQLWYSCGATPSLNLVLKASQSPAGNFIRFLDITGAASSSCYDTVANVEDTQTGAGADVTNAPQITPGIASGMSIAVMAFGTGPGTTIYSPSGAITDNTQYTGETDVGNLNYGDYYGHYVFSSTAQQTWNWHTATPVQSGYNAMVVTFKQAEGGAARRRQPVIN